MKERCCMCRKLLKKYTQVWRERFDKPELNPVPGKYISGQGIVKEIIRARGKPGDLRVTYWTGQVGYHGKERFCSLKCGYEWAMYECAKIEDSMP